MKTIAFINNKGGVGKTASVTSVAHMLATRYNKKVLVVDTDPQMNTTMMFSNVDFVSILNKIYKCVEKYVMIKRKKYLRMGR